MKFPVTYLELIQKHPELKEELLELRRDKINGLIGVCAVTSVFALCIGFMIGRFT